MSRDLVDLWKRFKVTAETKAWLLAESHVTGRSPQEIARDELHAIAAKKIHAAKVLAALSPSEGNSGDARGRRGVKA